MATRAQTILAQNRLYELRKFFRSQCNTKGFWHGALKKDPFNHIVVINVYENHLVFLNIEDKNIWVFNFPDTQIHRWSMSVFITFAKGKIPPLSKLNQTRLKTLIFELYEYLPPLPRVIDIFLGYLNDTFFFYHMPHNFHFFDATDGAIDIYWFNPQEVYYVKAIPLERRGSG